jgi:hypothetical protein
MPQPPACRTARQVCIRAAKLAVATQRSLDSGCAQPFGLGGISLVYCGPTCKPAALTVPRNDVKNHCGLRELRRPHFPIGPSAAVLAKDLLRMTLLLCEPGHALDEPHAAADELRTQVWKLLASAYPRGASAERRQDQRYPYPRLINLWPLRADGRTPHGAPITVVGKHLSERGFGFFHPQPLAHRRVIVCFEPSDGRRVGFLLDIHRCRFTRYGWYESGGRFLAAVAPPAYALDVAS